MGSSVGCTEPLRDGSNVGKIESDVVSEMVGEKDEIQCSCNRYLLLEMLCVQFALCGG